MSQDANLKKNGDLLSQKRSIALVSVGSNYPSGVKQTAKTIRMGMFAVQKDIGVIRAQSRLFRTPAFPPGSGPEFVNAAFSLETSLEPEALLSKLHAIEATFGRTRERRWAPRTLDLDLVAFDDLVRPDLSIYQKWARLPLNEQVQRAPEQMILPHPRMHERAFVLIPLREVAPDWVHPVFGHTITQLCRGLSQGQRAEVQPL